MAIEIVDFPIKNGDFPWLFVGLPEGKSSTKGVFSMLAFNKHTRWSCSHSKMVGEWHWKDDPLDFKLCGFKSIWMLWFSQQKLKALLKHFASCLLGIHPNVGCWVGGCREFEVQGSTGQLSFFFSDTSSIQF